MQTQKQAFASDNQNPAIYPFSLNQPVQRYRATDDLEALFEIDEDGQENGDWTDALLCP